MAMRDRLVTAPSVLVIGDMRLHPGAIKYFAEEQGISDYPKLYADTPIGRMFDHLDTPEEDKSYSDGEMLVEFAGRQCYGAWRKGRETEAYLHNILETGHGSVLAHSSISFVISGVSRSLTHELVRHSQGVAISQESQRFVDASNVQFVVPPALLHVWNAQGGLECDAAQRWMDARAKELDDYADVQQQMMAHVAEVELPRVTALLQEDFGAGKISHDEMKDQLHRHKTTLIKRANETARASLPNAAETKGVWTINYRALRHIIHLRGAYDADLEIRRLAAALAMQCMVNSPTMFNDVEVHEGDFGCPVVKTMFQKP